MYYIYTYIYSIWYIYIIYIVQYTVLVYVHLAILAIRTQLSLYNRIVRWQKLREICCINNIFSKSGANVLLWIDQLCKALNFANPEDFVLQRQFSFCRRSASALSALYIAHTHRSSTTYCNSCMGAYQAVSVTEITTTCELLTREFHPWSEPPQLHTYTIISIYICNMYFQYIHYP